MELDFNKPVWYYLFVALRFVAVFMTFGYLHPDEFFQSPEVVGGDVLGLDTDIPWEFQTGLPDSPCRTIVTPFFASGLPFILLKFLATVSPKFGRGIFLVWVPRLFLFLASFIVDYTAYKLSGGKRTALLAAASSWTALTFLIRPFSNTLETFFLCFLLLSTLKKDPNPSLIGIIIAVGTFNRFDFLFYSIPVIGYLIYKVFNDKAETGKLLSGLVFGFFATSAVIVFIDSIYFGTLTLTVNGKRFALSQLADQNQYVPFFSGLFSGNFKAEGALVVTPLNNLRYNMDPSNLAVHGTHPRWYHFALNMPLLFGPLYLCAVMPLSNMLDEYVAEKTGIGLEKGKKRIAKRTSKKVVKTKEEREIYWVAVACLVFHLGLMSIATHQEARFLLPNLICLVIIAGAEMLDSDSPWWVKGSWFAHGLILFLLLGFTHQAGVVRALVNVQPVQGGTTHLIFYQTYPPPKFLLGQHKEGPNQTNPVVLHPWNRFNSFSDVRKEVVRIKESQRFKAEDEILLVTPATIPLDEIGGTWTLKTAYWPHLSFEHPPETYKEYLTHLTLNVYKRE